VTVCQPCEHLVRHFVNRVGLHVGIGQVRRAPESLPDLVPPFELEHAVEECVGRCHQLAHQIGNGDSEAPARIASLPVIHTSACPSGYAQSAPRRRCASPEPGDYGRAWATSLGQEEAGTKMPRAFLGRGAPVLLPSATRRLSLNRRRVPRPHADMAPAWETKAAV
jgi:hypothetical protein